MKRLALLFILAAAPAFAGENICTDSSGNFTAPSCTSTGEIEVALPAAATSIGKAEDAASANADVGSASYAVRDDALTANAGVTTDGDYTPMRVDNLGALWTAGSQTEDTAYGDGDRGVAVMIGRNNVPVRNVDGGTDYMMMQGDTNGKLWVAGAFLEDTPSADQDSLMVIAGTRRDTPAVGSGADGDYSTLNVDAKGGLWVAGSQVEDTASANGDRLVAAGGIMKDNVPQSGTASDGDYVPLYVTKNNILRTTGGNVSVVRDVAITVDTAAYAAGDYINDADTITTISNIGKVASAPIKIQSVVVHDDGAEGKNLEMWFFVSDPSGSTFTDNAAFTVADADLSKVCCVVPITQHYAAADNGISQANDLANCICDLSGSSNIYAALVAREAVTFDAADAVTLKVTAQALDD